jgi:hypothetical protein
MTPVKFEIPDGAEHFKAAAFEAGGRYVGSGGREACEELAREIQGVLFWIVDGKAQMRAQYFSEAVA